MLKRFYLWVTRNMGKAYMALMVYVVVGGVVPSPTASKIMYSTFLVFVCFWITVCNIARVEGWK